MGYARMGRTVRTRPVRRVRSRSQTRRLVTPPAPVRATGCAPGTRAVVVRGGNPLRIRRADRPDLVLTADDGDRGAGMINGLLPGLGGTGRARPATGGRQR